MQIIFFSLTALKIFNIVNAGTELGLVTPLTTAASVSLFLTRIAFIYLFQLRNMFLLVLGNNTNPGYEKNVCSIRNRLNAMKAMKCVH